MILLDTCIILKIAENRPLPPQIKEALRHEKWAVSALSAWEISIKYTKKKLSLDVEPERWWTHLVGYYQLHEVPFTSAHAVSIHVLPLIHSDPFDRGIIATAISSQMKLASTDGVFTRYTEVSDLRMV